MVQEEKPDQKERSQDTVSVNARMPLDLVLGIDKQYKSLSRGKFTIKAAEYLMNQKKCVNCHALNNPKATKCWRCDSPIYSDDDIEKTMIKVFMDVLKLDNSHSKNLRDAIAKMEGEGLELDLNPVILSSGSKYDINKTAENVDFDDIIGVYVVSVKFLTKGGVVIRPEYEGETPEAVNYFWNWEIPAYLISSYLSGNRKLYEENLEKYENDLKGLDMLRERMRDEFLNETDIEKRNSILDIEYSERNKK